MIRARFRQPTDDPRPIPWPIKHPYWVSGQGEGYWIIVAYADDEAEILTNWPEAIEIDYEDRFQYDFTSRFMKPEWFAARTPSDEAGGETKFPEEYYGEPAEPGDFTIEYTDAARTPSDDQQGE